MDIHVALFSARVRNNNDNDNNRRLSQTGGLFFVLTSLSCKSNPCGRLMADRDSGAAMRRRQRRLRLWWRHEQQSIAAALATYQHHSAQRQKTARAGEERSEKKTLLFESVQLLGKKMDSSVKTSGDPNDRRFREGRSSKETRIRTARGEHGQQDGRRIERRRKCKTVGSTGAGCHEGRDQESENGQWQYCLQRGQHRSGTGVWYFCSATAVFVSME